MPTITISRLTGSDNGDFARELAHKLGYDFVDKDAIHAAALAARATDNEADAIDALQAEAPEQIVSLIKSIVKEEEAGIHKPHISAWFKESYPFDVMPYFDTDYARYTAEQLKPEPMRKPLTQETVIAGYRQIITHLAERGGVVIVGRGAQAILKDVPWVLHLRLNASKKNRLVNVAEMRELSDDKAEEYMERSDKWRSRFINDNFGTDWNDPELYHMTITMDRWKSYLLADAIASIVKSENFHATTSDLKKHYKWSAGDVGPVRRGI